MNFINTAHAGIITDAPSVSTVGINVLNFLLSLVAIVAIIMLVVYGIKYFFSGGDNTAMENSKKAVSYAILGIAMALGGMIIVKFIGYFF